MQLLWHIIRYLNGYNIFIGVIVTAPCTIYWFSYMVSLLKIHSQYCVFNEYYSFSFYKQSSVFARSVDAKTDMILMSISINLSVPGFIFLIHQWKSAFLHFFFFDTLPLAHFLGQLPKNKIFHRGFLHLLKNCLLISNKKKTNARNFKMFKWHLKRMLSTWNSNKYCVCHLW